MEHAQNTLNQLLASREDFRLKVEVTAAPAWPWLAPAVARWPRARSLGRWARGGDRTVLQMILAGDFFLFFGVGRGQVEVTVPGRSTA